MTDVKAKFWALNAAWGLLKAGLLTVLLAYGHALDERLPALAYGPCLILVLVHWVLVQEAMDYMLPVFVRWCLPDDEFED